MFLIFDTETTGLPRDWNAAPDASDNWPRLVQLAWQLHDFSGGLVSRGNLIVRPDGFDIPYNAEKVHGISTQRALDEGHDLVEVLEKFREDLAKAEYSVGHNIEFDINVVASELIRMNLPLELLESKRLDTKDISTDYCAIPGGRGGKFKWPTLTELHQKLFGVPFADAHDAAFDVDATAKCFFGLITESVLKLDQIPQPSKVVYQAPKLEEANFRQKEKEAEEIPEEQALEGKDLKDALLTMQDSTFVHIHNHSRFSVLQAASEIKALVDKAAEYHMPAVGLTDHGNMYGAFKFVAAAHKAGVKPIVGCEFNLCKDLRNRDYKDDGYQTAIIAKNKLGYHNLSKLASTSYIDGFYYVPRIDREELTSHREGLIALTGGLFSEIPSLILNVGESQAEEAFVWWKELFGDDFYVELNRHGLEEEARVNEVLLRFAEKYKVKTIASNNTYYINQVDANAHDILLCVKDGELQSTPKKYIGKRGREFRFGFPNDSYYFKSPKEMKELFADIPEAIMNIQELVDKCESYKLEQDVLLPKFDIPQEFIDPEDEVDSGKRGENAYLRHLTFIGAEKRYGEITDEIKERLDFELATIEKTGYPGYFLIVQDFTTEARKMGVSVGPGRGSAAGSAVAYCVAITNVDPIKYDLLFERFLNPDRVSLPDIDIDFDDRGRDKVINWVMEKYGSNQVAQIITYGTMAAKSSIRDTARVLDLPLHDADRLAKLVPDISLGKLLNSTDAQLKEMLNSDQLVLAKELRKIAGGIGADAETVQQAAILEGSLRNTGTHACGVIITPSDIREHIPVATAKDSSLLVTQYDNSVVENAGLLKMDFLGLKTLTLITDALEIIKDKHGITIDPDEIPLDDKITYELFQRGETVGIFQYESAGMQKHLRSLKPDTFADLIAMNALYRPGPLQYIPNFIARKHGKEAISYDLDGMEEFLKETYGITVYQEQVMLLSQKLAGFTKGEADSLRKGMGKKKKDVIDAMWPKFVEGCEKNGHDKSVVEKVWKDWEAFASYAFNKSHSTCYAYIAFQTAYLKANYPAEYMASVLSNNMSDIKQVTFFMDECRRMGIPVLGPSVNESQFRFTVNAKGEIRFGLGAIKGVGESAVENIVVERKENGLYSDFFDFIRRADLKAVNKRTLESLAQAGGFDSFNQFNRSQFFVEDERGVPFMESAVRYGNAFKDSANSTQQSLFGDDVSAEIQEPTAPECEEWGTLRRLSLEKEVVGVYISGHPLDDYKVEIESFCTPSGLSVLKEMDKMMGYDLKFAGMVTEAAHRVSKTNKPYGSFSLEDYNDSHKFFLFGEDYVKCREYLVDGWFLFISGKVQMRRRGDFEEPEFKIHQVELLSELRDKRAKELNLKIDLNDLNPELVNKLEELFNSNRGKCRLKIEIVDENMRLKMPSRGLAINPTNKVMDELRKIPDLEVKLSD